MFFKKWLSFDRKKKKTSSYNIELSAAKRVYTPVSQLVLGMYIIELDRPWLETSFMFQGFELKTQKELNAVKQLCQYVYIDTTKHRKRNFAIDNNASLRFPSVLSHGAPPKKLGSLTKEIVHAENAYFHTQAFMKKAILTHSVDGFLARKAVAQCVNSVLQSPDAMLWLTHLKNQHEQTLQHSLNVCILAIVLGRHLNLPEQHLQNLGLCGLMHDMGKMLIPITLLNLDKPELLNAEERQIMESHTTLGYELLKASDHLPASVIETALNHHERIDGEGYPRRLQPAGISDFAKIIAVVDTYDAMVTDRPYQAGRTHIEAISILTKVSGTQLDNTLVIKFIESLGVYPPGSLVELTNKAIGIVVESNEKMRLRPKIILILDEDNSVTTEQLIDLSKMITDKKGDVFTIKNVIKAEAHAIDTSKYYQKSALKKFLDPN